MNTETQPFYPSLIGTIISVEALWHGTHFTSVGVLAGYSYTEDQLGFQFQHAAEPVVFEYGNDDYEIYDVVEES